MKKSSIKKFSLLGLVLVGASAIAAAVIPKDDSKKFGTGVLQNSTGLSGNQQSCIAGSANQCVVTANSATTGGTGTGTSTSDNGGTSTDVNTSV